MSKCPAVFSHLKFRSLTLSTVVVALLGIAGCGGGDDEQTAVPAPAPPKPAAVAAPKPPSREGRENKNNANNANNNKPQENRKPVEVVDEDLPNLFVTSENQGNFSTTASAVNNNQDNTVASQNRNSSDLYHVFETQEGFTGSNFDLVELPTTDVTAQRGRFVLPPNFVELPEYGYDASGWPRRIGCQIDQSVMAYVPEGVFIQGKNGVSPNAAPEHAMFVSAFYIDVYEVKNESFIHFREYISDIQDRTPQPALSENSDPEMPVSGILWRDAVAYLEFVGKTLPTEAEWDKASRGAGGFDHPWGFGRPAYHKKRGLNEISVVMSFPQDQSIYGVYDMAGNVKEFCADWYHPEAFQQAIEDSGETLRNWQGPSDSEPKYTRVVKGNGPNWALWHREGVSMTSRDPRIGFRGVLRLPRN